MKNLFLAAVIAAAMLMASCGASKKTTTTSGTYANSPFGEVYTVPAAENDTDDYFGATGIASGPKARMGELQLNALTNAQNLIRQKMKHAYQGVIDDYTNSLGNNEGTDIKTKIERGGTQIIDVIVDNTQATKGPLFSAVDEKGNVTCYIGIRISKKEIAEKIADEVVNYVSEDEEMKIRFQEEQFRKKMKDSFKEYKETH